MRANVVAAAVAAGLALHAPAFAKSGRSGGILPGATASDPVKVDADKLDYFDKEQKLIYTGSVIVVNGPSTLKASKMIIFLDNKAAAGPSSQDGKAAAEQQPAPEAPTGDKVKHVDAEGPVTLVAPDQIATGDRVSFDRSDNKVYMNGNVTWTQGETVIKGERLVYDLTTKQAVVQGGGSSPSQERIHSIFTPKSQ
jgi:lipopolysaccharide export system protein LptA